MQPTLPPVDRDTHTAERVQCFSRYHQYTVGTELRLAVMRGVQRAVYDPAGRPLQPIAGALPKVQALKPAGYGRVRCGMESRAGNCRLQRRQSELLKRP